MVQVVATVVKTRSLSHNITKFVVQTYRERTQLLAVDSVLAMRELK